MNVETESPLGVAGLFRRPRFVALALVLLTLLVYWPVRQFVFVNYDDPLYALNPRVQRGLTPGSVAWAFQSTEGGNWHPLTWMSHMLDAELFGPNSSGPHVINLLLHAANTLLLFAVLRAITGTPWSSALVAALFALHPLHVESVAWISERKDVLSAFFGLLSLLAYARYAVAKPGRSTLGYVLAVVFFACSLMSKPMLVTLPFVLLLLDYWPLGRNSIRGSRLPGLGLTAAHTEDRRPKTGVRNPEPQTFWRLIREKAPFLALSAAACVIAFGAQQRSGAVIAIEHLPIKLRVANAFVSYARYVGKLFWPADLVLPYPHPGHWGWAWISWGIVLVTGLTLAAFWFRRRLPFLLTGWFWFLGMMLPVIGLVQVGGQAMADRYTYLPVVGLFIAGVWGAAAAAAHWRISPSAQGIAALLLLAACAWRTGNQLGHWKNSGTLFTHALAHSTNNYVAHDNLSEYLYSQGQVDEALEHSRLALDIQPRDPVAWVNTGHGLFLKGQLQEAADHFRRATELQPANAKAWRNLGSVLLEQKRNDEARRCFETAVRLRPDYPEALNDLGGLLVLQRQETNAVPYLEQALRLEPSYVRARVNLATALQRLGKNQEAVEHYRAALRLAPNDTIIQLLLSNALTNR